MVYYLTNVFYYEKIQTTNNYHSYCIVYQHSSSMEKFDCEYGNMDVNGEKVKDYNTKKFLGNKKEDARAWKIIVRNNKDQSIDMVILDQISVSTNL